MARILDTLTNELGTPKIEVSDDPLSELVATILSQNTTAANSGRAFDRLRERFPTWRDALNAPREAVVAAIRVSGLAETKAEAIQLALRALVNDDGEPSLDRVRTMNDSDAVAFLSALKGVGVKTAACVLMFGLGRDICPVDTHVHRVANRLGVVRAKSPDATFAALTPLVPKGRAYEFHVLLVLFGRRGCKARNPLCGGCVLFDDCGFDEKRERAAKTSPETVL